MEGGHEVVACGSGRAAPNLERALAYKNQDVVERFVGLLDVTPSDAEAIFYETKKWLWLCAVALAERRENVPGVPDRVVIDDSLIIIDEMWHNFICFTKSYNEFCVEYLGEFIHHFPTPRRVNDRIAIKLRSDPEYQNRRRRRQYEYVYDKLGRETLVKWYDVLAERYTPEVVRGLRLK